MLGKCANPSCSASFRRLGDGTLFPLEPDPRLRLSNPKTEYFWLCPTCLILGIVCHFAMTSLVLAQTATGVIRGTVQDRTGAVLTEAHLLLRNEARNQNWRQSTNEEGLFEFRALLFGNYKVEVEHPRFRKEVIQNIAV